VVALGEALLARRGPEGEDACKHLAKQQVTSPSREREREREARKICETQQVSSPSSKRETNRRQTTGHELLEREREREVGKHLAHGRERDVLEERAERREHVAPPRARETEAI
jgi:hypothetical protein